MPPSQENGSPCEGNFKPPGDNDFSTIVHGRLVQGAYAWLGTTFPRQYYIMSGNLTFGSKTYSRTSLLRTPGDFADLYVVSIGRCNHGPLNQIRYTKLPKQTL